MNGQIQSNLVVERTYAAEPGELWALWTTKEGFESWWGPEEFRADVITIEPRLDGALHYDMVADTPRMVEMMKTMGQPTSTPCRGVFSKFQPSRRLVLTQMIDFLPGVAPYDSVIEVDFLPQPDGRTRMVVTLRAMHDTQTTEMQRRGFVSQLTKLDRRYGWSA